MVLAVRLDLQLFQYDVSPFVSGDLHYQFGIRVSLAPRTPGTIV